MHASCSTTTLRSVSRSASAGLPHKAGSPHAAIQGRIGRCNNYNVLYVCAHACRGSNTDEQAFQWLDNVDSKELQASVINPALNPPAALGPPIPLVPGSSGEGPLVEGVPIQDEHEKLEIANAFRRGNLDGLLATCGFQRITGDMIEASRKAVGEDGITVHLPDKQDMAVRGYYRGVFRRDVRPHPLGYLLFCSDLPHAL